MMSLVLRHLPSALMQVTAVTLAALTVAMLLLRRRAAARHGVLVCGLIVVAACPLWIAVAAAIEWPGPRVLATVAFPQAVAPAHAVAAEPVPPAAISPAVHAPHRLSPSPIQFALMAWAAGSLGLLVRLLVSGMCAVRMIHRAVPVNSPTNVHVRATADIAGPVCVGLFRPIVLMPPQLLEQLDSRQLRQVLDHESAHVLRRDHLIVLLQRLVTAIWWVHPLVHLLNRALDRAREERCDNHVLTAGHDRVDYARTLLQVANWMAGRKENRRAVGALGLGVSRWNLERRIADLVAEKRNLMTRASLSTIVVSVLLFAAVAVMVSCTSGVARGDNSATAPALSEVRGGEMSIPMRRVSFERGLREFSGDDNISIDEVWCSSDKLAPGEIVIVKGSYNLARHDEASLAFFVTATAGPGISDVAPQQQVLVKKGAGRFELRHTLVRGYPHVSFYAGGNNVGGVYFGQGDSVMMTRGGHGAESHTARDARENAVAYLRQQALFEVSKVKDAEAAARAKVELKRMLDAQAAAQRDQTNARLEQAKKASDLAARSATKPATHQAKP